MLEKTNFEVTRENGIEEITAHIVQADACGALFFLDHTLTNDVKLVALLAPGTWKKVTPGDKRQGTLVLVGDGQ